MSDAKDGTMTELTREEIEEFRKEAKLEMLLLQDNHDWSKSSLTDPSIDAICDMAEAYRALLHQAPEREGWVLVPMDTITHLMEYWNGSRNDSAMFDALNHIMDELEKLAAPKRED